MRAAYLIFISLIMVTLATPGCAPRVPREVVTRVTWDGDFSTLRENPQEYRNEFVIFGGRIISTDNYEDRAEITVLQLPLDNAQRPIPGRETQGRFLIVSDTFLDPETYSRGEMVTVAGRVTGSVRRPIGEYQYEHPIIEGDIWVWEPRPTGVAPRFRFGVGIGKTF